VSNRPIGRLALHLGVAVASLLMWSASRVAAQAGPTGGVTPPDDTPSVKVGGVIFTDFTFVQDPEVTDADGNMVHKNGFTVGRAYINITGNLSHRYSFRITPDITRASGSGGSLDGSYAFRLKYAMGQMNLDEWVTKGSWVRLGLQTTPYIDYAEGIYRYRFQGTTFADRLGKLASSDNGLSAHINFNGNHGDIHVGVYNGESYSKDEANDQKAFQGRISVRPMPHGPLHGLRVTFFADADNYASGDSKMRWLGNATFEHPHLNAGFDFLGTTDQPTAASTEMKGQGWSAWATPRASNGWEGLLRYDEFKPNKDVDAKQKTTIGGIAYWFPLQKGVAGALMVDYTQVEYSGINTPKSKQVAMHALVSF
jgi:hypothetical protein